MTDHATDFRRQGYTVFPGALAPEALAMLREVCDRLLEEPPQDGGTGLHTIGLG